MNRFYQQLHEILSFDPGCRGLLPHIPPADWAAAARLLAEARSVLIVTGFPIAAAGVGETDGPIGAVSLASALRKAGKAVSLATDRYSYELVRQCLHTLEPAGAGPAVLLFRVELTEGEKSCGTLLRTVQPDLIIAIERPGKGADGHFHNMRGGRIDDMTADTDSLLCCGLPSIAVGDGGNELGMGNHVRHIEAHVPHGAEIAARLPSTVPITCGISNWGGWGLSALCSALCGRDLMTTAEEEAALLAACVGAGGVDGVLGQPVLSVDGLPMGGIGEVHAPLRAALADFLIRCK